MSVLPLATAPDQPSPGPRPGTRAQALGVFLPGHDQPAPMAQSTAGRLASRVPEVRRSAFGHIT